MTRSNPLLTLSHQLRLRHERLGAELVAEDRWCDGPTGRCTLDEGARGIERSAVRKSVGSLEEYYRNLELGLSACFRTAGTAAIPVKQPARHQTSGAVVFGSDQGLVGEVVVDFATASLAAMPANLKRIWPVGDRARALLCETGLTSNDRLTVPNSVNAITSLVSQLLVDIGTASDSGKVVGVYVFHNRLNPDHSMNPSARSYCRSMTRGGKV